MMTTGDVRPVGAQAEDAAVQDARLQLRLDMYMKEMTRLFSAEEAARAEAQAVSKRLAESEAQRVRDRVSAAVQTARVRELQEKLAQHAPTVQAEDLVVIRHLTSKLADLREALALAEERVRQLEAKEVQLEQERAYAEHVRIKVLQSTSWRITAPLRKLAMVIRRS